MKKLIFILVGVCGVFMTGGCTDLAIRNPDGSQMRSRRAWMQKEIEADFNKKSKDEYSLKYKSSEDVSQKLVDSLDKLTKIIEELNKLKSLVPVTDPIERIRDRVGPNP